jgi:hypothetical protein
MCVVAELRAVDVSLSYQFEEEIGNASSDNGLFIAKMEFSVRTDRKIGDYFSVPYFSVRGIVDKGGVTHYIAIAVRFQLTILTKFSKKMPASCPASIELAK